MPPEEILLVRRLGLALLDRLSVTIVYTFLYGIFIFLFSMAMYTFLHRGLTSCSIWLMFTTTLVSFLIATIQTSTEIAGFAIFLHKALGDNVFFPMAQNRSITNRELFKTDVITEWPIGIMPILSDIVVIWRAWVLFPTQRWLVIIPVVLLAGTIGSTFTYLSLISAQNSTIVVTSTSIHRAFWGAALALSTATNLVTTLMVAYKLWVYRKFVASNLGKGKHWSPVQKKLFLLVESGAIYCSLQLIYLIVFSFPQIATYSGTAITYDIFTSFYFGLSAMYPTIVAILNALLLSFSYVED